MSRLKKLPEKNLRFILKKMEEGIGRFGTPNELINHSNNSVVKDIFDDIGMTVDKDDLGFIYALYRLNPNYKTEKIQLPQLHTYEVVTKRYATVSIRELWKNTVESYFDDENDVQDFDAWFGESDWWNGEMIDREEYDEETTDTEYDEINKLS